MSRVQGWGALGVDLFFALSGILICTRLLDEERLHGSISIKGFYLRRVFRIFPAAYLYLAVFALLSALRFVPRAWGTFWCAMLFVRNFYSTFAVEGFSNRLTGHFWSLAVEEHFYLILPALLVFFPHHRKLALGLLTVACFLRVSIYLATTSPMMRPIMWETRSDLRLQSLFLPALIAVYLAQPSARSWLERHITPRNISLTLLFALVAGTAKHFAFAPLPTPIALPDPENPGNFLLLQETQAALGIVFFIPIFFPLVIVATMLHPSSLVARILELAPLRALGRISYSLYLWQQLFWCQADYGRWPIHAVTQPALGLVLSLCCAIVSYYIIEKPIIRLGHKLFPPASPGHRDLRVHPLPHSSSTLFPRP